jgi:hypothetical protein
MDTNRNETDGARVKLLSIRQAAKVIDGLTEYRIRQLCRTGELPYIRAGKKRLINERTLINVISAMDRHGKDGDATNGGLTNE